MEVDLLEGEEKGMKAVATKPEIKMELGKLSFWKVMGMVKRQNGHLSSSSCQNEAEVNYFTSIIKGLFTARNVKNLALTDGYRNLVHFHIYINSQYIRSL